MESYSPSDPSLALLLVTTALSLTSASFFFEAFFFVGMMDEQIKWTFDLWAVHAGRYRLAVCGDGVERKKEETTKRTAIYSANNASRVLQTR